MSTPRASEQPLRLVDRLGLNPWLQLFLTIISGTIVAVIAWNVIERFLNIIVLLLVSFLVAYLLGPLVDRLERGGLARPLSILLVYLVILGALTVGAVLLLGPLTAQLQSLTTTLPALIDSKAGAPAGLTTFFQQHGIPIDVTSLRNRLLDSLSNAGSTLLGGTLAVVAGLVAFVTDLFLVLAISFYLLLDGRGMHNQAVRLLPAGYRERWFFVEATLNQVLGGYVRGQFIVALTMGVAAGLGSALLGVRYPLVIGLLAFLFEFIPLVGPVLGMVVAVAISLFQPMPLVIWVLIYFIVLQQVEANVIVPRVSGHAVGLHPLAVLLALLAGVELGGLGGALLAVPIAGVLYVFVLALYTDARSQTDLLMPRPRTTAYTSLRRVLGRRGAKLVQVVPAASTVTPSAAPAEQVPNERLATIAHDQAGLIAKFEASETEQAAVEQAAVETQAPGDADTPHVA